MAFKVEKKLLKAVSSGVNYSCRKSQVKLADQNSVHAGTCAAKLKKEKKRGTVTKQKKKKKRSPTFLRALPILVSILFHPITLRKFLDDPDNNE